jgi:3-oxoacyl-[acyl-carrier protein] reductase
MSSISANIPGSSIAYSACKAAVDAMTRSLAKELAVYNIRVNSVSPGIVNTGFQVHNNLMSENQYRAMLTKVSDDYLLGVGDPADVSNLVMFLAAKENKWITGSTYIIDGGRSISL